MAAGAVIALVAVWPVLKETSISDEHVSKG